MNDETETEDEDQEWHSGPYCIHWSDPLDCEEECSGCQHQCRRHRKYDTIYEPPACLGPDDQQECSCPEFQD